MLVLSRRKNESVHIGGGILLTVVEIRGDKVRLAGKMPTAPACEKGKRPMIFPEFSP